MTRAEKYIALMLFAGAVSLPALSQPSAVQPQHARTTVPGKAVPLPHLYYHFLMLQSFLDTKAAALVAQGQDGSSVKADLQKKMAFSDAEYAPVYEVADQLAAQLAPLNAQAKGMAASIQSQKQFGIVPSGAPEADPSHLKALSAERQADIDAAVGSLTEGLTTKNKQRLDDFLVVFFAPKTLTVHTPPAAGQAASTGVQK